jgi:hypothetical protein
MTRQTEMSQNVTDAPDLICPDAAQVVVLEEAFQPLVAKSL